MNPAMFLITAIIAFALPLAAGAVWKIRYHGKIIPMLVGALTFFLFVNVLENLMHYVCLFSDNGISRFLNEHVLAYTLYGAFAAGIFEETGRFVAFKTLLRKEKDRTACVSYGIGHGGIEAILTVGANYILLTMAALAVGTAAESQYASVIPSLSSITPGLCAIALTERVFAMIFHISASVLVFAAAKNSGKIRYYPLAILLHALLDVPAVLYQRGLLPLLGVEALVAVYALCSAFFARRVYRKIC